LILAKAVLPSYLPSSFPNFGQRPQEFPNLGVSPTYTVLLIPVQGDWFNCGYGMTTNQLICHLEPFDKKLRINYVRDLELTKPLPNSDAS
jgi:hypothetical protein